MKKLSKKLRLDRETVRRLDLREMSTAELGKAQGGLERAELGKAWTGCLSDCTQC